MHDKAISTLLFKLKKRQTSRSRYTLPKLPGKIQTRQGIQETILFFRWFAPSKLWSKVKMLGKEI